MAKQKPKFNKPDKKPHGQKKFPDIVKPFMHEGCIYLGVNRAGEFMIQNEAGVWRTTNGEQLDFLGESLPEDELKKLKK